MSLNNEADTASHMQTSLRRLPYFVRELAAGGVAGGLAKTCCAPLERTKILLQTGRSGASIPDTLSYMWHTEGIKGLFKGNIASVLRIVPYAAVHFSLYEQYRRWLIDNLAGPGRGAAAAGGHVHPVWDLLAGSLSGATAVMATYPLDLVRTRLAYATEAHTTTTAPRASSSSSSAGSTGSTASAAASSSSSSKVTIRSVIARTLQQEGVAGLYKGITPTLLGILPYAGIKFYVYQSLKAYYRTSQQQAPAPAVAVAAAAAQESAASAAAGSTAGSAAAGSATAGSAAAAAGKAAGKAADGSSGSKRDRLPVPMMLLFGGASGLVAQTLTYPLDLVRRRMQVYSLLGPLEQQQHHVHAAHHPHAPQQRTGTHIPRHLSAQQHGAAAAAGTTGRSLHQATGGSSSSSSSSSTRARAPNTWQTFRELWGRGGLRALYKGLSINYIKVVPSTAIGFTIYDALKAYLDLRGNI